MLAPGFMNSVYGPAEGSRFAQFSRSGRPKRGCKEYMRERILLGISVRDLTVFCQLQHNDGFEFSISTGQNQNGKWKTLLVLS